MNAVQVLLEETDPVVRSRAHLALGQLALAAQREESACAHLREAFDLDPTDETPKKLLETLNQARTGRRWWPFT